MSTLQVQTPQDELIQKALSIQDTYLNSKPQEIRVFSKALQADGTKEFDIYFGIQKMEKVDKVLKVCGWASVSDTIDNQGDIITAAALKGALAEWKQWGNIRLMHQPIPIGKATLVEIREHPVTKTDAAWLEADIVDERAIKLFEANVLKGWSIGGRVLAGGREEREVEIQ